MSMCFLPRLLPNPYLEGEARNTQQMPGNMKAGKTSCRLEERRTYPEDCTSAGTAPLHLVQLLRKRVSGTPLCDEHLLQQLSRPLHVWPELDNIGTPRQATCNLVKLCLDSRRGLEHPACEVQDVEVTRRDEPPEWRELSKVFLHGRGSIIHLLPAEYRFLSHSFADAHEGPDEELTAVAWPQDEVRALLSHTIGNFLCQLQLLPKPRSEAASFFYHISANPVRGARCHPPAQELREVRCGVQFSGAELGQNLHEAIFCFRRLQQSGHEPLRVRQWRRRLSRERMPLADQGDDNLQGTSHWHQGVGLQTRECDVRRIEIGQ
mmetsp:Transcript_50063/g.160940  ORF Transcript_50063/g.160940 Transcript_50063/m.160940 type:complete len:321 (-) Transcript_50063:880-1842(-)